MMNPFLGELIGTAILILLGNGVVANVVLRGTKGEGAGWIVITWGWGMAVFVAVFTVAAFSGAHINPAVSIGLALAGKFAWESVPTYILAQFLGAMIGTTLVWAMYYEHFRDTENRDLKLAVFCTGPAIRKPVSNLVSEIVGTFVLVFAVLFLAVAVFGLGALDALPVGLLVLAIGLSLGGTTGYAINPARDLGPRIFGALVGTEDLFVGTYWLIPPVLVAGLSGLVAPFIYDAVISPFLPTVEPVGRTRSEIGEDVE